MSEVEEGHEVPVRRRRVETATGGSRAGVWLAVGLVTAGAAIAGVVLTMMKDTAVYSKPIDDLVRDRQRFVGRPVRAEGVLVPGTLVKRDKPCEYRFVITRNAVEVPVRFAQCVVPDTFRDVPGMDVAVTVEGELLADNTFEASLVLAKCPSKYEMNERKGHGEAVPHGPTEGAAPLQ